MAQLAHMEADKKGFPDRNETSLRYGAQFDPLFALINSDDRAKAMVDAIESIDADSAATIPVGAGR